MNIMAPAQSGRSGKWVYYMYGGKQCRRHWVKPRDPRTPAQLRVRAIFGTATKTWSHSEHLSEKQLDAYRAAGAKIQSHPRLGQSGPLTGQQYYVGKQCSAAEQRRRKARCRRAQAAAVSQAIRRQRLTRAALGRQAWGTGSARYPQGPKGLRQVLRAQRVTKATSGSPRALTGAAPAPHRKRMRYAPQTAH